MHSAAESWQVNPELLGQAAVNWSMPPGWEGLRLGGNNEGKDDVMDVELSFVEV